MSRTSKILALAALLLVGMLYAAWTPREGMGQLGRDGPRYMMMAEHYSLRHRADAVYAEMATFSHLPPLYPVVLAWTGAADDLATAHKVTTAILVLALLMYYAWMRQMGASTAQGTLFALLFAVLPSTWTTALLIQSEFLYLLLSLAALVLLAAYNREPRRDLLLAAALTIGAATLCRAVGICLLPALLLAARRGPLRLIVTALLIALTPALAWNVLHHSPLSYSSVLPAIYGNSPEQALLKQLTRELPALRRGLEDNFVIGAALRPLVDALGLACLASLFWRSLRLRPDAAYLATSCMVILVWPFPEEAQRFLWVVMPLALLQPVLLLAELRREPVTAPRPTTLSAALAALFMLMLLPALELRAERYLSAPYSGAAGAQAMISWYGEDPAYSLNSVITENAYVEAMRLIAEEVPESDCVLATRPDLINYYARRRSELPPLNSTPDPQFTELVRRAGCHYIFGVSYKDSIYPVPLFPLTRLKGVVEMRYVSYLHDDESHQDKAIAELARLMPIAAAANPH